MATLLIIFLAVAGCHAQNTSQHDDNKVGGPFENGDFMYVGMPPNIHSVDTSPGWSQHGQQLLIHGTIYKRDGKTPAPGVILYYYHTDVNGYYADRPGLDKRVARHGYIRGWVMSDSNGHYSIYTVRPAPYPNRSQPAHIHPSIKEPGIDKEYYIDEFVFDDDPLLTAAKRQALENRGGSGVLRTSFRRGLQVACHDIILGLHIPNYPGRLKSSLKSGKEVGEDLHSFTPFHAWGADKGTTTCPVCKYGKYQGVLFFAGNNTNWSQTKQWLQYLDKFAGRPGAPVKMFFIYGEESNYNRGARMKQLQQMGSQLQLSNVALTFVPSFNDVKSEVFYNQVNPDVENTIIVYRHNNVIGKYINLKPTEENFRKISGSRAFNAETFSF